MKIAQTIATLTLCITASATLLAQTKPAAQATLKASSASSAAAQELATGEVLRVYPKEKRLLLKHGPIPSIGMSPMTMEYGVADSKMLARVKPGAKVRFMAVQVKDEYVVTHIELAK